MKVCNIYNFASHYRGEIYKKIDKTFDCRFLFGDKIIGQSGIKSFPTSELRDCAIVENRVFIKAPFYWQRGVLKQVFYKFDRYILLGEPFCVSSWIFLCLCKFFPKKRTFLWTHGWYGRENFIKKIIKKIYFSLADGIFTYGDYAKQLMQNEGFRIDKIFPIHNSLNYSEQKLLRESMSDNDIYQRHFSNDYPNLIFIGRLTKIKRIDLLLESLHILKNRGKNFNLTIVGDGDLMPTLSTMVKKLDLDKNVWFYGACYDEAENANLIYNADLCVSPGNVGLTAIHCFSFGCPVITHNNFSMQMPEFEVITEGKTGSFFEYNNTESLADSIQNWFSVSRSRAEIRNLCFNIIDKEWNPNYQIEIIKRALK